MDPGRCAAAHTETKINLSSGRFTGLLNGLRNFLRARCAAAIDLVNVRERECLKGLNIHLHITRLKDCTAQRDLPRKAPALHMRLKKQLSGGRVPHLLQKAERRGGVSADLHLWLHPQKAGMFVFLFVSHEVKEQRRIPHVQQILPSSTGKEGPRHKLGHIWA